METTVVKVEKVEKKIVPTTNNDVRQKCRDMIKNSLKSADAENGHSKSFFRLNMNFISLGWPHFSISNVSFFNLLTLPRLEGFTNPLEAGRVY